MVTRDGGDRRASSPTTNAAPRRRSPAAGTRRGAASSSSTAATSSCSTRSAGTRRQITRTTGPEANPRWARRESAVTFTRDNNLYLVPLDSGELTQLTDVQPKKRDPRETDSQKFVKAEEQKLIEHTRIEAEKKKKAEEKEKARALPKFELADRQTADRSAALARRHATSSSSSSSAPRTSKRPNVPNYVTESSYTEDIPVRTFVGDAQDKRALAVLNLEISVSSWPPNRRSRQGGREVRWGMPQISDDGAMAVAHVRADDNKDRWLVVVDPETGKTRVVDALHDDAWVSEVGGPGPNDPSFGWLPDQKHVWFLSERDGWMHLYAVDASAANAGGAAS